MAWVDFHVLKFIVITGVLLLPALQNAPAANDKEIRELYRRGLAGDKQAVEECIGKLEATLKAQPRNQLARVYLGSAYTLRSRDLGFGPKKLQALRQGLAVMDEAVANAPDEPKVRLARALTTSALPAIFGRAAQSRQDFEQLAAQAEKIADKFQHADLQIIYYHAGLAARKSGDRPRALSLWQAAQRYSVDAAVAKKIEAELSKL